ECAGKVKNAHRRGDELALRLAAQGLAERCPSVLRPVNPAQVPGTRYEALLAALALPVAPPGYRNDMLLCLGLTGQPSTMDEVSAATFRLAHGALELLRPHAPRLTPELEPDRGTYLADGRLQRYLAQIDEDDRSQTPRSTRAAPHG
nr:phosphoribosyl-AMP cyclohydrolase [Chloroflexota bacterium]